MKAQVVPALVTVFAVLVNVFTFATILKAWGVGKETFFQVGSLSPEQMANDIANLIRISVQSKENITLVYRFPLIENVTYDLIIQDFTVKIFCRGCAKEFGEDKIPVDVNITKKNFTELQITKNKEGVFIGAL